MLIEEIAAAPQIRGRAAEQRRSRRTALGAAADRQVR